MFSSSGKCKVDSVHVLCSRTTAQDYLISMYMHCNASKSCSVLQSQAALFAGLSSQPQLRSHNPEQQIVNTRTRFLCVVITAAMQTIQVECDESGRDDKVLPLLITMAVFSVEVIHGVDEGYIFCKPKIMRPHTKILCSHSLKFCSMYKYSHAHMHACTRAFSR